MNGFYAARKIVVAEEAKRCVSFIEQQYKLCEKFE
jgi:hypothetical protein